MNSLSFCRSSSDSLLEAESHIAPEMFLRMKKGDSYSNFRLLFSEVEHIRTHGGKFPNHCKPSQSLVQVDAKQHKKIARLQDFNKKRMTSHLQEMNKYIFKRWNYCKRKRSQQNQADCIRPTIEKRYQMFTEKERIYPDESYVENRITKL